MRQVRKLTALTRAGIIESLQFRLGTFVTLFANLIYLALVYFLWKSIYASAGTDTVNGMTFYDTMIYLILTTVASIALNMIEKRLNKNSISLPQSDTNPSSFALAVETRQEGNSDYVSR